LCAAATSTSALARCRTALASTTNFVTSQPYRRAAVT
jgi:hypothetical protein